MLVAKAAFVICLLLLPCTLAAYLAAVKAGDLRRGRSFQALSLGLAFSTASYLLHLLGAIPAFSSPTFSSPTGPRSLLGFACRVAGISFLWRGLWDEWRRRREEQRAQAQDARERDDAPALQTALPPGYAGLYVRLNSRARETFAAASEEAFGRRQGCIDTDHLLLGLLCVRHCAASRLLEQAGVSPAKLASELVLASALTPSEAPAEPAGARREPALTHRARQVLVMAELESHRFGKTFIGTEHLLLGLMLVGTGPAAAALFAAGLTVDGLRRGVMTGWNGVPRI